MTLCRLRLSLRCYRLGARSLSPSCQRRCSGDDRVWRPARRGLSASRGDAPRGHTTFPTVSGSSGKTVEHGVPFDRCYP